MADDNAQHRNLPASARKLQRAREDGQLPRSRDLGHFAAIGAGGALLVAFAPQLTERMSHLLNDGLRFDARGLAQSDMMLSRLAELTTQMLWIVLPLGAAMIAIAFAVAGAAGGMVWTWKPLAPQFSRLNPIAGLPRLFSAQQLTDTLKASGMALALGLVGALYLNSKLEAFSGSLGLPLPAAIGHASGVLLSGLMLLLLVLAAFALIDVPLQFHMHRSRLKMSHQEVKQENKEQEGNAEVKAKVRARMREMANKRMLAAVPKADLVVMNPTHYAVALRYDEATMVAPRVVAKGADLMALRIRDLAKDHKVPVLQAPPLARALYAHAEVDREIPAALFAAVAQVLAYVYQLRASLTSQRVQAPAALPELQVPAELDPHNKPVTDTQEANE